MILFTRAEANDFRTLLGRCVSGRPRGPAPVLVIRFAAGTRTIAATTAEGVILMHTSPAPGEPDELLVLPGDVLVEVEGGTDEGVNLARQSKLRGVLHWHTGSKPRTLPVELLLPGRHHQLPIPAVSTQVSERLLTALHECSRSAAKDSGRFALSKIQIQGQTGRVIGTNAWIALLCEGFQFTFADSVLVPALTVFGSKPLTREHSVRLGRTVTHLVIEAGAWSIWLPADTKSRYPDVPAVIPRQPTTEAIIDRQDAAELLKQLPSLPGNTHELRPVTLDVSHATVTIRGNNPDSDECGELPLTRSRATGTPASAVLDRRVLARLLSLECFKLRLTPNKPLVAEGDCLTFMAAQLDPALLVPPPQSVRAAGSSHSQSPNPERSDPMKTNETNGSSGSRDEPPDPLVLAEELRTALADAALKAGKLSAALKAGRKEKKVLATVYAGLKQLNLDGPNA